MHAKLRAYITIGNKTIGRANSVVIKRSISSVCDTCIIKLPTQMVLKSKGETITKGLTASEIKEGDEVIINLWYNDNKTNKEFHGFVKRRNYSQPVEIECEDFAYLLRTVKIQKTYPKTSLKEVLTDILNQVPSTESGIKLKFQADCDNIDFTNLVIADKHGNSLTGLQILQMLKDKYGIAVYFNDWGELYAGLLYKQNLGTVVYKMGLNTIREQCSLKYHAKDDTKLKIKAICIDPSGERTEAIVGNSGGLERTVILYDVKDKTQLEALATNELKKYSYDGYDGTLKTFLEPQVFPAYTASLSDSKYPDRDGEYFVEQVITEFTTNGARRTVSLGPKI